MTCFADCAAFSLTLPHLEVCCRRLVRYTGFGVQPPALAGAVAAALPAAVVRRPARARAPPLRWSAGAAIAGSPSGWGSAPGSSRAMRLPPHAMPLWSARSHRSGGAKCGVGEQGQGWGLTVLLAPLALHGLGYRGVCADLRPHLKTAAKEHLREAARRGPGMDRAMESERTKILPIVSYARSSIC